MKLKNFKALIVAAQSAVEIALQKFLRGLELVIHRWMHQVEIPRLIPGL